MESLGDAYAGPRWEGRDPRRVFVGATLFAVGVLAVVVAIVVGTGSVNEFVGAADTVEAQGIAGIFAGLGIPALMVGVVAVLPSSRRERLGVVAGATRCVAGVWLFTQAYPHRWAGAADDRESQDTPDADRDVVESDAVSSVTPRSTSD